MPRCCHRLGCLGDGVRERVLERAEPQDPDGVLPGRQDGPVSARIMSDCPGAEGGLTATREPLGAVRSEASDPVPASRTGGAS